jgi:hypothetical protein
MVLGNRDESESCLEMGCAFWGKYVGWAEVIYSGMSIWA